MSNAFTDVLSPDVGIKLLWANVLVLFLAEICPFESLKCSRYFFFKPVSNPIHNIGLNEDALASQFTLKKENS